MSDTVLIAIGALAILVIVGGAFYFRSRGKPKRPTEDFSKISEIDRVHGQAFRISRGSATKLAQDMVSKLAITSEGPEQEPPKEDADVFEPPKQPPPTQDE